MFKKKPQIKPSSSLKSSERRRLADDLIKEYNLEPPTQADATPEQKAEATTARTALRNAMLPENVQSARFTTTHGPDLKQASGTVYIGSHEGEEARILWLQLEGKIYPSVYTLWRHPDLVALLHTPEVVVKKLQGGADLMTPGLVFGPPFPSRAKKGAVVAIASMDKPSVPVAVGVCQVDVSALQKVQGEKGHAVQNMHWCGDELWSYSLSGKSGQQPPEEIEGWAKVLEEQSLSGKTAELELEDGEDAGGVSLEGDNKPSAEDEANGEHAAKGHMADAETAQEVPEQAEAKELTQKEIDTAFRNAFLYGIHHHKTSQPKAPNHGLVFPLSQSFVMSTLVQPFLPAFTPEQAQQLQIKKTSWKNIKKFIKTMDKEKIIKSKEKDGHETVIVDIDFDDAAIVDFKPYRLPKKETVAGTSQGRGDKATEQIDTRDDSVGQKLQVVSFYKPTAKLQSIFEVGGAGKKQLFAPPEVRELVTAYIEKEKLISETNKRLVKLNPTLGNAVFDGTGSLDKEVLAKGAVPRDALVDRILRAMSPSYAIVRNGADPSSVKAKSGSPPKIRITLETRSGNKTVTKVSGLEAYSINPRPLADELRKVCAGSTSVEPLAGAAKKHEKEVMEVMVQGPQKDAVVKALERRGVVTAKWVEVLDKSKGQKGTGFKSGGGPA
jgi:translation initiation factor 2D